MAHVAIKMEPEQSEIVFDRTQDSHTITGTRLQQTEDFGIVTRAGDTSFQPNTSIELKREAEDALHEGESGRDAKRIKKDLKQEDPPYREDSMPPYRQPSPYIIHRPD